MRLDRNGIPILDSPKDANKLKRRCPIGMCEMRQVNTEVSGYDAEYAVFYYRVYYVCVRCGAKETRDRIDK